MHSYEHTFIAKQDLSESQIKKIIEKYKDIISKYSGEILKTEDWGLRNLSYEINKNKKGFYFHIKLKGEGTTIEKLEFFFLKPFFLFLFIFPQYFLIFFLFKIICI